MSALGIESPIRQPSGSWQIGRFCLDSGELAIFLTALVKSQIRQSSKKKVKLLNHKIMFANLILWHCYYYYVNTKMFIFFFVIT